jgi:hypothetical protein
MAMGADAISNRLMPAIFPISINVYGRLLATSCGENRCSWSCHSMNDDFDHFCAIYEAGLLGAELRRPRKSTFGGVPRVRDAP